MKMWKGKECGVPKYEAGDYIKVEFPDEATGVGEWMWVRASRPTHLNVAFSVCAQV